MPAAIPPPPATTATATATATAEQGNASSSKVITPQDIVDAFKSNGSFDTARTELLRSFMSSSSGERFSERAHEIIMDKLHKMYDAPGNSNSSASQSNRASTHGSPPRPANAPKNRHDATEHIIRELEKQAAYEKAEKDMDKHLLADKTKRLDADLSKLLEEIKAKRGVVETNAKVESGQVNGHSGGGASGTKEKEKDEERSMQVD